MDKKEIIPFFMDFPYLEPMEAVLRLDELRFSSYPQLPQLHKQTNRADDCLTKVKPNNCTMHYRTNINIQLTGLIDSFPLFCSHTFSLSLRRLVNQNLKKKKKKSSSGA